MTRILAGTALAALGLTLGLGAAVPQTLPLAPLVRDPVFAVLVGYVRGGYFGVVTRDEIAAAAAQRQRKSRLPWKTARDLARVPSTEGPAAEVTLRFQGPLDVSIPYQILWYKPGRIRSSATCRLREWHLPALPVATPHDWKGAAPPALADVSLFSLDEGELLVDVDGWLDALMGSTLDDTRMSGLAVARFRDREYGFGFGHNRKGQSRIGVFDLTADAVVFPIPKELRAANRTLRRELERLAAPLPGV